MSLFHRNRRWLRWFALALLVLATAGVYWQVGRHEFLVYDDPDYVSSNGHVLSGLTAENAQWAFTQAHSGNWHPLTWVSHMTDVAIFGKAPGAHHLVNLSLHILNALLLLAFLNRTTGRWWPAWLVAGLFALHPLHVESVAWISERKDVLSTFFLLLTLLSYARYAALSRIPGQGSLDNARPGRPQWWYFLSLFLFAAGLMSKPMLVTVPVLLLLLDFWPLQRLALSSGHEFLRTPRLRRLLLEKLPFAILSGVSCVLTLWAQRKGDTVASMETLSAGFRASNSFASYLLYLVKMVVPVNLAVFYPFRREPPYVLALLGLCLLLTLVVWAAYARSKRPYLIAGWLWYIITLLPVIGLVQVGEQSMADRYTYIPFIGVFIALAWWAADLSVSKPSRLALTGLAAVTLVALSIQTFRQAAYWKNSQALFEHALAVTDGNYLAQTVLAGEAVKRGDLGSAAKRYEAAIEMFPEYPGARLGLAQLAVKESDYARALELFERALALKPNYPEALAGKATVLSRLGRFDEAAATARSVIQLAPAFAPGYLASALILQEQGNLAEAERMARQALIVEPGSASALCMLGDMAKKSGRIDEALRYYAEALGSEADSVDALYGTALAQAAQGRLPDAVAGFTAVVRKAPRHSEAHYHLGLALSLQGKLNEAVEQFGETVRLKPKHALAWYNLGVGLERLGRGREARSAYENALAQDPKLVGALNNLAWLLATTADSEVRNGSQAIEFGERACALTQSKEPVLLGTLAAAYAEAGRFDEAIKMAEQARSLALQSGQEQVAARNAQLLELYRAQKPYHEGGL